MKKPVLSPAFTIDDIHKLREYNYELTKEMSKQQKMEYYNKIGNEFLRELNKDKWK